jgi:PTH1 family peptidyl-tRNA hydrolase
MVVDRLATRWNVPMRLEALARIGRGLVAGHAVQLVQPQTYVNRSGEAVGALALQAEDAVMAVYDDLDLAEGQLRVRPRGGTGGHRGVASLSECLGETFARVRVGVGRPPPGEDAADYVLAAVSPEACERLRQSVERASDAVECVIAEGVESAMNRFNTVAGAEIGPAKEER